MYSVILAVLIVLCLISPFSSTGAMTAESFLIPGVDFSKLTFEVGAWCRYLVIDEALDQIDTTEIYIGVPSSERTDEGAAYWVELESRPLGAPKSESQILKLLVLDRISEFSEGDSLGQYVLRLYNKSGAETPQEEDPRRFKGFSQVIPTNESSWVTVPGVPVRTSAGGFTCSKKERNVNNDKEIQSGKVTLIKESRDDFTVWFCEDVPVFHLVKCDIVRLRETRTVPRIAGIPPSGRKDSRTSAELMAYGFDAKPLMSLDAPQQ